MFEKIKYIPVLFSVLVFFSCGKSKVGSEISGNLENLSGKSFLAAYEQGDSLRIDTVFTDNGSFSFQIDVDTLTIVRLYFNQNTKSPTMYIFADKNWDVKLKGDALYPDLTEVKGGDINDDLSAFKKANKDLLLSRAKIMESEVKNPGRNKDDKKYIVDLKNVNFELSNIAAKYIKENPEKISSVVLINTFFKDETLIPRLDETLALLKGKASDFPMADDLRDFSSKVKKSSIGATAPYFSLKDNNKPVSPSLYRGKYLLLSFVATTCDVCDDERKDYVAVYDDLKKQKENIDFLTIVIDTEEKAISKSVRDSVKWTLLPERGSWSSQVFDLYNVHEVPYNILIAPNGTIVERDLRILDLPERLKELIGSAKNKN